MQYFFCCRIVMGGVLIMEGRETYPRNAKTTSMLAKMQHISGGVCCGEV